MIMGIMVTTEQGMDTTADPTVDTGTFMEPATMSMRIGRFQGIMRHIMDTDTGTDIGTLMTTGMVTEMAGPRMDGTEGRGREDAGDNKYSGGHIAP
jgi:hypothetical protein